MERDVIITVFACSQQAPCKEWAKKYFTDAPIVLVVPGGGGGQFRQKAISWAKTGDAFKAALKELAPEHKDVKIRRRGIVTFSVGWSFMDELLKFKDEVNKLNAYLLLDGCHTEMLDNWIEFASRAANLEAFMAMAHTAIKPPFVSSTATNNKIFNEACKANDATINSPKVESSIPDYILKANLPENTSIFLGAAGDMPAVRKTYNKDPLIESKSRGDLTILSYDGDDRPDHCYVAWYVANRLWKWLGETWKEAAYIPENIT